MKKYQPHGGYDEFREDKLTITALVRIDVEETTSKEDIGTGSLRDEVIYLLDKRGPCRSPLRRSDLLPILPLASPIWGTYNEGIIGG